MLTRSKVVKWAWGTLLVLFMSPVSAQPVLFEENERFHPVMAKSMMVAAQEARAAQVGRDILAQGGNAVDAAVAVGFALAVTLPRAGNLGGGGFMLIWLAKEKRALAIDYRESAPAAASANLFINSDGKVDLNRLTGTVLAAGVPGTVAGFDLALKRYGTMTLAQVLAPAIKLAADGITVTPGLARALLRGQKRLQRNEAARAIFFKKDGALLQVGERFVQTDLAASLQRLAQYGAKDFYHGKIAKQFIRYMKQRDGLITAKDLAAYRAYEVKPLRGHFQQHTIYAMPPPSSGGVTLLETLNILENFPLKTYGYNSAKAIHVMSEAMNFAFWDRNQYLGDPAFVKMPLARLLSKTYAKRLSRRIDVNHHIPAAKIGEKMAQDRESRQTTHYSVIDQDGNMVANTYTLNYSFGSGLVVPGTGILLNNEMDDFAAKPGIANSFGLIQGKSNAIAPNKRPLSSMAPIFIINPKGKGWLASGTPGGSRIITTMAQFIVNLLVFDLNIATATSIPRMHSQLWPDKLYLEQGISIDTRRILQKMGHHLRQVSAMGSIQTVQRKEKQYLGYADSRRSGALAIGE